MAKKGKNILKDVILPSIYTADELEEARLKTIAERKAKNNNK